MIQPLYVWPYPITDEDRALIKAAKDSLGLDFQVRIEPAFNEDATESRMDSTGRALILRVECPLICDSAAVPSLGASGAPSAGLIAAVKWCVTDIEDDRASTVVDKLLEYGYKELSIDEIAYKDISRRLDLSNEKKVRFKR